MPFSFNSFALHFSGQSSFLVPLLTAYHQPRDRKTALRSISSSVTLMLSPQQLVGLPSNFDGWQVERSDNGGVTWAVISGWIRNSFYFVDTPPSDQVYQYRCQIKLSGGGTTSYSPVLSVSNGQWGDADNLSTQEVNPSTGIVTDRWAPGHAVPNGIGYDKHTGLGTSEGSFAGSYGEGAFYLRSREVEAPITLGNAPACGAVASPLPLASITYSIQDQPFPGGSGIDDTTLVVRLSVASQFAGAFLVIHNAGVQPWAAATPLITCVSVPGGDPVLERDITIAVPVGYILTGDVVQIETIVRDLDGNELRDLCSFTMVLVDQVPPVVSNQDPVCGTGIASTDASRVSRNTSFKFLVSDSDSGVDVASIQVYHGLTAVGPWTQVLQNGSTFLLGFTGSVVADGLGGYDVEVVRPVNDPLWPADTAIYFRVVAVDIAGNVVEDICGFRTRDCVSITRIVPIADDLLLVEFSSECRDGEILRAPENYLITPDPSDLDASEILVRKIIPQRFLGPGDPLQTGPDRLGVGNPKYVLIETTRLTAWGLYRIQTQNLIDEHGEAHCLFAGTPPGVQFRAQFTALNEARADFEDEGQFGQDTNWRAVMTAMMFSQQQLSGVYSPDDWE